MAGIVKRLPMMRREVLALAGGMTIAWPFAAGAQRNMPVLGFLSSTAPGPYGHFLAALLQGLNEAGFSAGQNLIVEQRWADNEYERLPRMAADLVARQVNVLVAAGGNVSTMAAKDATTTIPIVFTAAADPVRAGLVASLNRPGANVTGIALLGPELDGKRLELLHELVPKLGTIGVFVNPNRPDTDHQVQDVEAHARSLGRRIHILRAGSESGIEAAFATLTELRIGAIMVAADPFFANRREVIVALAARHAVPAMYQIRDFVAAGGLFSYGASLLDCYRQAGVYAGRILNGAKTAEMPVFQASKFELVINLRTARALGIEIPPGLLARADEVIEA